MYTPVITTDAIAQSLQKQLSGHDGSTVDTSDEVGILYCHNYKWVNNFAQNYLRDLVNEFQSTAKQPTVCKHLYKLSDCN